MMQLADNVGAFLNPVGFGLLELLPHSRNRLVHVSRRRGGPKLGRNRSRFGPKLGPPHETFAHLGRPNPPRQPMPYHTIPNQTSPPGERPHRPKQPKRTRTYQNVRDPPNQTNPTESRTTHPHPPRSASATALAPTKPKPQPKSAKKTSLDL